MRLHRLLVAIATVLLVPAVSSAEPLYTTQWPINYTYIYPGAPTPVADAMQYRIAFRNGFPPEGTQTIADQLFEDVVLRPSDVGRAFTATAASDPDFLANAALLTDGLSSAFVTRPTALSPQLSPLDNAFSVVTEGSFFQDRLRRDLAGHEVQAIRMTLDSLAISDYSDTVFGVPRQGRQFTGSITFTVEGVAVPEPASLLFLPLTAVLLCRRRL